MNPSHKTIGTSDMKMNAAIDETFDALDGTLSQDEDAEGGQDDSMVADWLSRFNVSGAEDTPSTGQAGNSGSDDSPSINMVTDAAVDEDEIVLTADNSSQPSKVELVAPAVAPETRNDLLQLREIANSAALGHVTYYACRRAVRQICGISIIAPIVMGMSIYSVMNCISTSSFHFALSCTLFLVATELVRRSWVTFDKFRKMLAPTP